MEAKKSTYYLDMLEIVLLCAVAFLIPVHIEYTSLIIAALGLMFLVRPRNYKALCESAHTLGFWAMIIPFALYLIGLIYSEDLNTALHNTETALSLLAFPFIATAFRQNGIEKKLDLIYLSLIAGILIIMTFSIINAYDNYVETQNINAFFYTYLLRSPHHHSYYAIFAVILLAENIMLGNWKQRKLLIISEIVLIIANVGFICLLSSKITILILSIYALYIIIRMLLSKRIPKWLSITTTLCIIVLSLAITTIPMVKYRIDCMIASVKAQHDGEETIHTRTESTTIRIKCMASALDVISENWLIGTGQGDIYAEMQKKMKLRMGENYEGTCATHNQFLRSFASFGIMGITSLLLLFFAMFRKAIKSRKGTMIWWCIITFCFFCIEDMFCIINGIIFFCMFTGILLIGRMDNEIKG
ncbi:MAG: O-antigen ligase family protein [Bacteroidales bacterium]|nr:O-antigen ligase family protein [Bacteroidales bacterium]